MIENIKEEFTPERVVKKERQNARKRSIKNKIQRRTKKNKTMIKKNAKKLNNELFKNSKGRKVKSSVRKEKIEDDEGKEWKERKKDKNKIIIFMVN